MESGCKTENVVFNVELSKRETWEADKKYAVVGEMFTMKTENGGDSVLKLVPILLGLPCF